MKKVINVLLLFTIIIAAIYLWLIYPITMGIFLSILLLIMFWPSIANSIQNIKKSNE